MTLTLTDLINFSSSFVRIKLNRSQTIQLCLVWLPLQAKDELNETDEKRVSAVKELRGIIKEKADGGDDVAKGVQETFGEKPDSLLVRFIRARKYDVPRAFELMKGAWAVADLNILTVCL